MYPVFHAPRPRLPSVLSVFGPIEQYQADRDKRSLFSGNTGAVLEPLDAYLAHLLVNVHPGEPVLLDLTAEQTSGASTLLDRSLFSGNTGAVLEPLDAYLAHLLVNVHPGEPVLLDLTAEQTSGASTL